LITFIQKMISLVKGEAWPHR